MIRQAESTSNIERWVAGLSARCPICLEVTKDDSDCDREHWSEVGSPENVDDARIGIAEWWERGQA